MSEIGTDRERVTSQLTAVDVHGLIEIDVTDARERIRTIEEETGTKLSFTAFVVSCLATTVDEQPHVQRYRDW